MPQNCITFKGTTLCNTITYDFKNGQITHSGTDTFIEFDIYAKQSNPAVGFKGADIYFTYNTTTFGNRIVDSNDISITRGVIINDTTIYSTYLNDTLLKSDIVPVNGSEIHLAITTSNSTTFIIADTLQKLCHVKMKRKTKSLLNISFDRFFMEGQSFFNVDSALPYVNVYTGGTLGLTNDDCADNPTSIRYGLYEPTNAITYSNNTGYITFDITAASTTGDDFEYGVGSISIDCGSAFANSTIATYYGAIDTDYTISVTQNDSLVTFTIFSDQLHYTAQLSDGFITTLFSVKMSFDLNNCQGQGTNIKFDDLTNNSSPEYYSDSDVSLYQYCSVSTDESTITDLLCPPPTITDITSSAPTGCITAGSFDEVTITGDNFINGSTASPIVIFNNSDFGEGTIYTRVTTLPNDILSYSQTKIVLLIPSEAPFYSGTGWGTAGSGDCFVEAPDQQYSDPYNIYIHFANSNIRGNGTRSGGVTLGDNNDPLFVYFPTENLTTQWVLDSNLFAASGALDAATKMVNDINCNLGTAYTVNQTNGVPTVSIVTHNWATTYIGVSANLGSGVLAATSNDVFNSCYFPGTSSPTVNNPTGMSVDALKSSIIYIQDDGTLGNPSSTLPGHRHWWFDATTLPPDTSYYDFATVLLHELGHATLLYHSNDQDADTRIMYYSPPSRPAVRRTFATDPDDIQAGLHMFTLGSQLGQSCVTQSSFNEPAATSVFPQYCTVPSPACGSVLVQGIDDASTIGFDAFLYPNPSQNNVVIHIDLLDNENVDFKIVDVTGKLLMSQKIADSKPFDVTLNVANFSAGLYLVKIVAYNGSNKTIKSLKLIKIN